MHRGSDRQKIYGARYLDPKYSRWISTDPALGEYVSKTSKGEGGIYNGINLNLYHYANNNPINYKDPDGEIVLNAAAAVVGALSGAAIGAVTTAIAGGSGRDIAAAALGGAASGALAGVTLGGSLVAQAAGAAAIGAVSGAVGDVVTNAVSGNEITAKGVGKAALGGAVGGLVGFGAGKALSAVGNKIQAANAAKNATKTLPYSKSRPPYAKGQVDKVWENAKDPIIGKVYDPSGVEITWDKSRLRSGQWDMGHIPEAKYSEVHGKYMNGEITKKEFLDWYHDPKNYRPELPSTNRSHKFE